MSPDAAMRDAIETVPGRSTTATSPMVSCRAPTGACALRPATCTAMRRRLTDARQDLATLPRRFQTT